MQGDYTPSGDSAPEKCVGSGGKTHVQLRQHIFLTEWLSILHWDLSGLPFRKAFAKCLESRLCRRHYKVK